jgi:Putative transposase/Transposase zinc-binding domain
MSNLAIGPKLQTLFGQAAIKTSNAYSRSVFLQLHQCHTPAMGMHVYQCGDSCCHHVHQQYHSCGNRHCPNCGGLKKEQWIENLTAQLFPTTYYHVVFTVPHEFNALMLGNRKAMFNLLFEAASATLLQFAGDAQYLGAACGITAVLHTWGQQLVFHPHLHCIVSGGGIKDNQWVHPKQGSKKFLFPVAALAAVYKGIFLKKLRILLSKGLLQTEGIAIDKQIRQAGFKKWNVYAKAPFGTVASVVEYLGRYSHKVAITKHRIQAITDHSVIFKYKDYTDGSKQKQLSLGKGEFMRRFELHFLPRRYVKIRHYGFLQNHGKTNRLNAARASMKLQPLP